MARPGAKRLNEQGPYRFDEAEKRNATSTPRQRLASFIPWLVARLTQAGMVCLIAMALLTCIDVVGRFFGHPVFGSIELVGFMATFSVAAALPYTHRIGGHIGVELVMRLLPGRIQAFIELGTSLLSTLLFGLIAWRTAVYGATIQRSGEVSMSIGFPEYVIIYLVSFCFFILFLMLLQDVAKNIAGLRGKP